jgi:hypothetical protein
MARGAKRVGELAAGPGVLVGELFAAAISQAASME